MMPGLAPAFEGADPNVTIINCLPDGFVARTGGNPNTVQTAPVHADGHWWWYLMGQGWAAEDWLAFHHEGEFPYPARSELADKGLIAFLGDDQNVWVMNADGSGRRLMASRSSEQQRFSQLQWSHEGDRLAFTVSDFAQSPRHFTRVVDADGAFVAEHPGVVEALWSPDGKRLSAIQYEEEGGMGGYRGTPIVLDLASGAVTKLGPSTFYLNAPAWSPDGSQLAYMCVSPRSYETQPDGTTKEVILGDCNGDGLRLVSRDATNARVLVPLASDSAQYYANPSWSPDGQTIALSTNPSSEGGCRGYVTVTVETGGLGACIGLPPWGALAGGCGGSAETGATDWSPDGRYLAFHSMYGTGSNGVFVRDNLSGGTTVIPSERPSAISFSRDGQHLAFEGAGMIFVSDVNGEGLALLGTGYAPAWQPR
jgi:Tol biopolymer transport system component